MTRNSRVPVKNASQKRPDATDFSHTPMQSKPKNAWVDPHRLNTGLRSHGSYQRINRKTTGYTLVSYTALAPFLLS